MSQLNALEDSLVKANKDLPKLPKGFTDFLVMVAPWFTLLGGLMSLYSVYAIWHWAHWASDLNNLYNLAGVPNPAGRLSAMLWVSMASIAVLGVIYLMAFSGLKNKQKKGWDLLFLASLVNVVYGIVTMFTDYSYGGGIFGTVIGTLIGWYFLFQIRDYYTATKAVSAKK